MILAFCSVLGRRHRVTGFRSSYATKPPSSTFRICCLKTHRFRPPIYPEYFNSFVQTSDRNLNLYHAVASYKFRGSDLPTHCSNIRFMPWKMEEFSLFLDRWFVFKNLKTIRSHGDYLLLIVGIGGLGIRILDQLGEKPKLRTFSPALYCFVDQMSENEAYMVEQEILNRGLSLEEPEIAALLSVSAKSRKKENVYEYMQKLRMCAPSVSESTAGIIEACFHGEIAEEVGTDFVDGDKVKEAILKNGGGWHGMGWIGKGKWMVQRTNVDSEGCCRLCKDKLACLEICTEEREACSVRREFGERTR